MKIKLQIPDLSILVTVASTTLYLVFRNLGREAGSFAFLWAPITLLIIIYTRPNTFFSRPMKILFLYGIIMVGILQYTLWKYMNNWNQVRILLEFYYLVVMTTILRYYLNKGEFIKLAWLSKWAFVFIIITLISTNIALFFEPYVIREFSPDAYRLKISNRFGAMGYSFLQAIVCLIPILVYHIKNKRNMVFTPRVLIVVLILIVITELRSQVFANMLVTVLIIILSFVWSKNRSTLFITISLACILFVVIPTSFYANKLYSLSSNFAPNSLMNERLADIVVIIKNQELDNSTDVGARLERYPLLFNALVAMPLLGDASNDSGQDIAAGAHLYWMNRLTLWGIPGFLFFVFVLYKIYKSISSLFDAGYRYYYFLSVMAIILLGLIKAVGGRDHWLILIVVIPGLYYLPLLGQAKKK